LNDEEARGDREVGDDKVLLLRKELFEQHTRGEVP
jgi:hypothetical protein